MGAVCLLLIVLVPVLLAKPREQSIRRLCGASLAQIGKTMLVYANDYEGTLPRAGGSNTAWGPPPNWMALTRYQAFGLSADGQGGLATISSSFYLLVKYYETPTRLFICRGDKGTTEFKLSDLATPPAHSFELTDAWDFGPIGEAYRHCSFSYLVSGDGERGSPFGTVPVPPLVVPRNERDSVLVHDMGSCPPTTDRKSR